MFLWILIRTFNMLIARTLEESESFIEQELSHILRLESKPLTLSFNGFTCLVDSENQKLVYFPERKEQQEMMKTKEYGNLAYFDNIKDFIDSKYNKCVIALYCSSSKVTQKKKTITVTKTLESKTDSYFFDEKENTGQNTIEFFSNKDYEFNKIKNVTPQESYWFVLSRNRYALNGVQIINNFQIKSKN